MSDPDPMHASDAASDSFTLVSIPTVCSAFSFSILPSDVTSHALPSTSYPLSHTNDLPSGLISPAESLDSFNANGGASELDGAAELSAKSLRSRLREEEELSAALVASAEVNIGEEPATPITNEDESMGGEEEEEDEGEDGGWSSGFATPTQNKAMVPEGPTPPELLAFQLQLQAQFATKETAEKGDGADAPLVQPKTESPPIYKYAQSNLDLFQQGLHCTSNVFKPSWMSLVDEETLKDTPWVEQKRQQTLFSLIDHFLLISTVYNFISTLKSPLVPLINDYHAPYKLWYSSVRERLLDEQRKQHPFLVGVPEQLVAALLDASEIVETLGISDSARALRERLPLDAAEADGLINSVYSYSIKGSIDVVCFIRHPWDGLFKVQTLLNLLQKQTQADHPDSASIDACIEILVNLLPNTRGDNTRSLKEAMDELTLSEILGPDWGTPPPLFTTRPLQPQSPPTGGTRGLLRQLTEGLDLGRSRGKPDSNDVADFPFVHDEALEAHPAITYETWDSLALNQIHLLVPQVKKRQRVIFDIVINELLFLADLKIVAEALDHPPLSKLVLLHSAHVANLRTLQRNMHPLVEGISPLLLRAAHAFAAWLPLSRDPPLALRGTDRATLASADIGRAHWHLLTRFPAYKAHSHDSFELFTSPVAMTLRFEAMLNRLRPEATARVEAQQTSEALEVVNGELKSLIAGMHLGEPRAEEAGPGAQAESAEWGEFQSAGEMMDVEVAEGAGDKMEVEEAETPGESAVRPIPLRRRKGSWEEMRLREEGTVEVGQGKGNTEVSVGTASAHA